MANILWVEDDADRISGLVKPLSKAGHQIYTAKDKKEALAILKEHKFDLIILDIIIPDGEYSEEIKEYVGVDLLKKIKSDICPDVPIIVSTIVNDKDVLNEVSSIGVEKILKKGSLLPSDLKKIADHILINTNE